MPVPVVCEKRPARSSRGMMATNHPLASVAGAEVLLEGGVLVGASCRRADRTPVGISGGLAKPGVRFAV